MLNHERIRNSEHDVMSNKVRQCERTLWVSSAANHRGVDVLLRYKTVLLDTDGLGYVWAQEFVRDESSSVLCVYNCFPKGLGRERRSAICRCIIGENRRDDLDERHDRCGVTKEGALQPLTILDLSLHTPPGDGFQDALSAAESRATRRCTGLRLRIRHDSMGTGP